MNSSNIDYFDRIDQTNKKAIQSNIYIGRQTEKQRQRGRGRQMERDILLLFITKFIWKAWTDDMYKHEFYIKI